jgi:hypothetical protein
MALMLAFLRLCSKMILSAVREFAVTPLQIEMLLRVYRFLKPVEAELVDFSKHGRSETIEMRHHSTLVLSFVQTHGREKFITGMMARPAQTAEGRNI